MAEEAKGQRFSQRAGGFLDKITGSQGAQQTQQTQQQTSGQQSTGGVFLPGISNANIGAGSTVGYTGNREKMTYIASNELQGMEKKGVSEIQTPKTNIPLPGITLKPLEQVNKEIDDKYKRIKAENIQLAFIDAKERSEKYGEQVNSEIGTQFEQGARQWWNNVKKAGKGAQSLLLERMAQNGYVNGAFGAMGTEEAKKKESEWINDARNSNLEYKKKINDGFKKWQKENVNQDLVKEYNGRTFSELITRGDMAGVKYKTIGLFADNISLLPNIIVTTINTPAGLTLMGSDTFIQESQNGFDEMIENGANYEEARNGAMWIGALNAGIEMAGEELFGIVGPASRGLRKLFIKNAVKEIEKKVAKKTLPEIVLRAGGAQLKSALGEGGEEVLQEIVTNAFVNTVNKDRSLLDNLWQSFEGGAVMGLLIPGGALESVTTDVQTNRQIQRNADIEALKYVAEGEQRKAQRMAREKARARFLERVKNPTMDNGYTPTPEQAQQREQEKIENEEYEQELQDKYDEETRIEQDMMNEALSEGDLNEDLGDPRYQKSDSPQSVSEDTVREKSRTGNVSISSENSSEISKNLNEIKKNLEDLKADTFLQQIKKSISGDEKNSNYITNRINGNKYVLRIADHHANAKNSKKSPYNNTSIVVKLVKRKNNGKNIQFKKYKSVDMIEFVYNPENMTTEKMQGIIDGIQNWIKTGEYTDTNYDSKNQSTRKIGENKKSETGEKYQLKYEEEGYTPGVARKDEKNISGKSGKMLKDFLKGQTIEELAKKYGVERIDVVKGLVDGMAYGSYSNRILRLAEEIKESTAPHELLHLVFDMVDPETKTYLISQVMQSEGWSAEKAEEWLADSFSNFYRTGKIESAPKSTWGKIKIFFKRVRSFINGMWKWRNQLEQMFTDIIESSGIEELQGKIDSNKEINKSKAKMRKRFLEYRRNTEKTQAESTRKTPENWEKNVSKKQIADESIYKLQPLERIEQMEKLILDEYGTTDEPTRVAFVDNKGRWINGNMGGYGNYRDTDHREIAQTAFDDTDIEFNNATDGLVALQAQTGLVRVNFNDGYMNIDTVYELMPSQKEGLMRFDDIRYQRVYHGSPNEFDRFDSSHMGEGEGNQAHGRGHYVAVDPQTARRYAQEPFRKNEVEIKGKTMTRTEDVWDIPYALRTLYRDLYSFFSFGYYDFDTEINNAIDQIKKEYEDTVEYYENLIKDDTKPPVEMSKEDLEKMREDRKESLKEFREALEFIEDLKPEDIEVREIKDRRNFYEVEIPDPVKANTPTGKNYIEEENRIGVRAFNRMLKRFEKDGREVENGYGNYTVKKGDDEITLTNPNNTWKQLIREDIENPKLFSQILNRMGYNGIHYYGGVDGEAYVIFDDNDLEIKNHEKYQKVEYEYDENGNRKWIKFGDNSEFDPSIFGEPSREEQIEEDKENEKGNPFYNAWMRYNNQNYKDDQLTFEEFIQGISERGDKEQAEYNKKLRDISEAQNDPQLLDLQLRAVKLMEEEGNVGKKFGKNVSKEVRDRQQKEVESKREQLISDIVDYMYPGLKTEEITYDMQKEADQKEAEREMLGREDLEEKLKYFKKDKNGNREAKDVKIENPQIKLDKILSAGKFDEIFTPLDRVIEWKTPQGQHGVIDNQKNPKKYKSVMEKINAGKTKTKVTLKDVTRDYRALEKYKADQEAEKARKKKERDEAYAKKKQEEYKKIVRMKAFQRLVDMQRFEKYPFLTEEEIKNRYGFTDEEWKKITEQEEIKLPKKRGEKAISDFNKAVYDQVRMIRDGLERQNRMKQKDAEKNLGEIGEIDVDILLGRDEEKGQKEVEEFEKIAEEEKKKSKKEKNKRMKEAVEEVLNIDIDTKREQQEKEKIEKMLKKVKNDETGKSKLWRELKTAFSTVDHKIKNISKPIYQALMQYFQNTSILTNERLKEATPFINALKKIRKENPVRYMDIRVALANRNIGYANGLLQEYGVKVPTKLLDTIYDEAEDVGLNINYLGSYYPLKVRSPKSLLTEIMGMKEGDFASEIDKRIKEESEKNGGPLDESQISDIIAEVIAGEDKGPDVRLGNAHMKKRNEKIKRTPKMLEYCYDPVTTLIGYIEGMTQSIERAKFLGKSASGQVRDLSTYVYKVKHDLTWEQQDELMYLLQAVFNDKQQGFLFNTWRDIATLTTLGSPTSTLTQIGDLGFSIYENGLGNTWKALWNMGIKKGLFDLEDMGIINRGEEFTNINEKKTRFQKGINLVFKITGFSKMDMFGKGMYIKSTRLKRQKRAKKGENGDPQLRKDIMKRTDDEYVTDKIISDIRHGIFSKEVSMIMFMKLSNFQPLTRAQMPEAYLNHPGYIRMLYQFKTFGLKQTNYIISECREALKEAKNGTPQQKREAVGRIVSLVASLALMGLGADELKDLLMRRRNESMILRAIFGDGNIDDKFVDKFVDNLAKLSGLSRYAIMNIKNDPVGIITSLFTDMPGENVINYPYRDIKNWLNGKSSDQMTQLFPVVGKRYYWAIGGGHDKQMEKLDKENKKSTKKKSSGSTRKPLTR